MQLIDNAKSAWRHFSTIALASGAAIQGVWIAFPNDLKAQLPDGTVRVVSYLTACILVWGLVGKFIKQPTPEERLAEKAAKESAPHERS